MKRDDNLIVWSEGEMIDRNGRLAGKSFSEIHGSVSPQKSGNLFQELLKGNYIFHSTLLYKKQNLEGIRYDAKLTYLTDYKFVLELARSREFYYIADRLAQYRIHGRNTLIDSGPEETRKQYAEEILVREDALRQFDQDISHATKAAVFGTFGFIHRELGNNKRAIRSFLQAILYDPLNRVNQYYLLSILRLVRGPLALRAAPKKSS
jgi:hypothetical protein